MIRAFGNDAPDAVFAFLEQQVSPRGREHWLWKYRTSAGDTPSAFYWQEDDGSVLGFIGMMRTALCAGGARHPAAWFVDWHVRPGAKGVGVGIGLLRKAEAAAGMLLTLQGSADTQKILPRLGWKQSPAPRTWLRPLSGRFLSSWLQQRAGTGLGAAPGVSTMLGALAWPYLRASAPPSQAGLELVDVERVPESYDETWAQRAAEMAPAMRRDADYLNYLCADFPDGGYGMQLLALEGRQVGHVIRRADRDKNGLLRGRIVDLLWPASRPELAAWLVRRATAELRRAGADYAECVASTSTLRAALASNRFRARRPVPIWYHRLASGVPDPDGWHITLLDCDRAYR
jgi:hypothetical protein